MRGDAQLVSHGANRRKGEPGERHAADGSKQGQRDRLIKSLGTPLRFDDKASLCFRQKRRQ